MKSVNIKEEKAILAPSSQRNQSDQPTLDDDTLDSQVNVEQVKDSSARPKTRGISKFYQEQLGFLTLSEARKYIKGSFLLA